MQEQKDNLKNWVFSKQSLDKINQIRLSKFNPKHQLSLKDENDVLNFQCYGIKETIMTRGFVRQLAGIKLNYLGYKIVFTAIQIFKRFYLLMPLFGKAELEPMQTGLLAIYIGMKLEEVNYINIELVAIELKKKERFKHLIHFGDEKYNDYEQKLLKDLNFDLSFKSIFRPIESMIHHMQLDKNLKIKIEEDILKHIVTKTYYDQLIFQHPVNLIALSVMRVGLKKSSLSILDVFKNQTQILECQSQNEPELLIIDQQIEQNSFDIDQQNIQPYLSIIQSMRFRPQQLQDFKKPQPSLKRQQTQHQQQQQQQQQFQQQQQQPSSHNSTSIEIETQQIENESTFQKKIKKN